LPIHEQDAEWLRLWDEILLRPCHDAAAARTRYKEAVARTETWRELEAALARGDAPRVRELAEDPLMRDYPPALALAEQINALIRRAAAAERVLNLLKQRKPDAFSPADLQFIADNEALFRPYRTQLVELLGRWLATDARLK